jgi:hypothetical protein
MPKKTISKNLVARDKDYQNLLAELKSILAQGQYQAYKAVDNIKVQTYWQLGERIVREELKHKERADYGKYLIGNLTVDLGIGRRLLYEITKFYRVYPIVHALRAQLSWTHYRSLNEIESEEARTFYENKIKLLSTPGVTGNYRSKSKPSSTSTHQERRSRPYSRPSCRLLSRSRYLRRRTILNSLSCTPTRMKKSSRKKFWITLKNF